MFKIFNRENDEALDAEIEAVIRTMNKIGPMDEQYPDLLRILERLNDVKAGSRRIPVSGDTIATILGSLLGIGMIIIYEDKHVITSKAFSLLPWGKRTA